MAKHQRPSNPPVPAPQPTKVVTRQEMLFQGPLPPPTAFEQYERILPGTAERILQLAEREAQERHANDRVLIRARVREAACGQWFGFILGLLTIGGGLAAIILDKPVGGLAAVLAGVVALAGAFLVSRQHPPRPPSP